MCVWVIGVGGGGGGIGRINVACRDPVQPRFGHISSCKPDSSFLSVPGVRKKCYKIPPENDLCLCEDIFQQHQAKLVNCDMEDANAVESYKEPNFDFNENVCNSDCVDIINNECCCGGSDSDSESSKSSSVDEDERKIDEIDTPSSSKSSLLPSPNLALEVMTGSNSGSRQLPEKLTAEERNQVLRELDDIMTGRFLTKVRRFSQDVQSSSDSGGNVDGYHRRSGFPMQQFDDCRSQLSSVAASRLRVKRSSSLNTEEMVNYGKVAELTRRFSRLGEASVITPQRYRSEPNFFRNPLPSVDDSYGYDNEDLLSDGSHVGDGNSGDDYDVVQQPIRVVFIRPMSYSDDRLNSRVFLPSRGHGGEGGGGLVLTEVTSDGENDVRRAALNATQTRRRSFRKSVAFDSSLSSVDGDCGAVDESDAIDRYLRLKGGWPPNTNNNFCSKSSDVVSVSNVGRSHRRYSSVDVYDQSEVDVVKAKTETEEEEEENEDAATATTFLDVEKTEKEFRDGLVAVQNRRHEAIRDYLANKELLLIKMKSASVGGILRWNQEHQDTLLDDEELLQSQQPKSSSAPERVDKSSSDTDEGSPKEGMRRVLRTGLKGRRIRRLRKLESRSSGFALADLWRVSKDEPRQHSTAGGYSSTEPPDNHNNTL